MPQEKLANLLEALEGETEGREVALSNALKAALVERKKLQKPPKKGAGQDVAATAQQVNNTTLEANTKLFTELGEAFFGGTLTFKENGELILAFNTTPSKLHKTLKRQYLKELTKTDKKENGLKKLTFTLSSEPSEAYITANRIIDLYQASAVASNKTIGRKGLFGLGGKVHESTVAAPTNSDAQRKLDTQRQQVELSNKALVERNNADTAKLNDKLTQAIIDGSSDEVTTLLGTGTTLANRAKMISNDTILAAVNSTHPNKEIILNTLSNSHKSVKSAIEKQQSAVAAQLPTKVTAPVVQAGVHPVVAQPLPDPTAGGVPPPPPLPPASSAAARGNPATVATQPIIAATTPDVPGAPPPPPPVAAAAQDGREALLASIQGVTALKKTVTNDRSKPIINTASNAEDRAKPGAPPPVSKGGQLGGAAKPVIPVAPQSVTAAQAAKVPPPPTGKSHTSMLKGLLAKLADPDDNFNAITLAIQNLQQTAFAQHISNNGFQQIITSIAEYKHDGESDSAEAYRKKETLGLHLVAQMIGKNALTDKKDIDVIINKTSSAVYNSDYDDHDKKVQQDFKKSLEKFKNADTQSVTKILNEALENTAKRYPTAKSEGREEIIGQGKERFAEIQRQLATLPTAHTKSDQRSLAAAPAPAQPRPAAVPADAPPTKPEWMDTFDVLKKVFPDIIPPPPPLPPDTPASEITSRPITTVADYLSHVNTEHKLGLSGTPELDAVQAALTKQKVAAPAQAPEAPTPVPAPALDALQPTHLPAPRFVPAYPTNQAHQYNPRDTAGNLNSPWGASPEHPDLRGFEDDFVPNVTLTPKVAAAARSAGAAISDATPEAQAQTLQAQHKRVEQYLTQTYKHDATNKFHKKFQPIVEAIHTTNEQPTQNTQLISAVQKQTLLAESSEATHKLIKECTNPPYEMMATVPKEVENDIPHFVEKQVNGVTKYHVEVPKGPPGFSGHVFVPRINEHNEEVGHDILEYKNGNMQAKGCVVLDKPGKSMMSQNLIDEHNDAVTKVHETAPHKDITQQHI